MLQALSLSLSLPVIIAIVSDHCLQYCYHRCLEKASGVGGTEFGAGAPHETIFVTCRGQGARVCDWALESQTTDSSNYVYIYIHVYMHVCTCICICSYDMCVCIYIYIYICIYIHTYTHVCVYMCVSLSLSLSLSL